MPTYTVWTLDVWGNPNDGYEVNDRCKCGTIELPDDADDMTIIRALIAEDYLSGSRHITIDGDDLIIEVNGRNDRPLLTLERND